MFYVGVDIAKSFNVACIIDDKEKVIKSSFKFKNDEEGFSKFLTLLSSVDTDISNFIIGMEATGLLFQETF